MSAKVKPDAPRRVLARNVQRGDEVLHARRRCRVLSIDLMVLYPRNRNTPTPNPRLRFRLAPLSGARPVEVTVEQMDFLKVVAK